MMIKRYYCTYHKVGTVYLPLKRKCIKRIKVKKCKGYVYKKCKYLIEMEEDLK